MQILGPTWAEAPGVGLASAHTIQQRGLRPPHWVLPLLLCPGSAPRASWGLSTSANGACLACRPKFNREIY